MEDTERIEHLLECLINVIGRVAIPLDKVFEIVGTSPKFIKAFNLCNGMATQLEIAKKCGLDPGSFNRMIGRWVANGVAFRIGGGKDARLLHIYPISEPLKKNTKKR